jgi:hypothetical protein
MEDLVRRRQTQRAYNLAHKAEIQAWNQDYRLKNKTKIQAQSHAYYLKHKEKLDFLNRKWASEHPESVKKYTLKYFHNITSEQYWEMFLSQGGVCKICGRPSVKTLHVDHDHRTGEIRGLLCSQCNSLLGFCDDSVVRLQKAIKYLLNSQEINDGKID